MTSRKINQPLIIVSLTNHGRVAADVPTPFNTAALFCPRCGRTSRLDQERTVAVDIQQAVFCFLADPVTHGGQPVKRIDTHAASVFLAGKRAFKVKRAVRFPFLDYSTLERRHAACLAEVKVNQRFAPQIYRGVVAIRRAPSGELSIGGCGTPVEWAVEMRRFDEAATLDRVAEIGQVDFALAEALGRMAASMHATAPAVAAEPWIHALPSYLDQNYAVFRSHSRVFAPSRIDALDAASRQTLARLHPLLEERGGRGLVRRGHGDLHLGNIVVIDGHPVPFDAVEFDPVIASGDVLYDLAFLLMDLVDRGLSAAANRVLNRYLIETRRPEDLDGLTALPFFLSLRAAIRAMVVASRLDQTEATKHPSFAQSASAYFDLACKAIVPPPPTLVAIGGLSGSGKSELARALAPELTPIPGGVVLRSDVERKALFGVDENHRLAAEAYGADVTARVYATLQDRAQRVVTAGHSTIVDATFADAKERWAIAAGAAACGVTFRGLFLQADLDTRVGRVGARRHDASDADVGLVRRQHSDLVAESGWRPIDASGIPSETLRRARDALC